MDQPDRSEHPDSPPPSPSSQGTGPKPVLHFHVPREDGRPKEGEGSRLARALILRGTRRFALGVGALLAAVVQAAIIAYVALQKPGDLPASTQWLIHYDKLLHAVAFAWLGYWTMLGLHHATRWHVGWSCVTTVAVVGVAYGVGIEVAQHHAGTMRTFDLLDIVADLVGCIIATSVLVLTAAERHHRPTPH